MGYTTYQGKVIKTSKKPWGAVADEKIIIGKKIQERISLKIKGLRGKNCNRQACQKPPATYFNNSTKAWYCEKCADELNHWSLQISSEKICEYDPTIQFPTFSFEVKPVSEEAAIRAFLTVVKNHGSKFVPKDEQFAINSKAFSKEGQNLLQVLVDEMVLDAENSSTSKQTLDSDPGDEHVNAKSSSCKSHVEDPVYG